MTWQIVYIRENHPQGTSVGRPHNSPLMKLPIRPAPKPSGTSGAIKSVTDNHDSLYLRASHIIATITPRNPPWKDIPPCQIARISSGCCKNNLAHKIKPAPAYHLARHPARRKQCIIQHFPGKDTTGLVPDTIAPEHNEQEKSEQVHQPVPANSKRTYGNRNRIKLWMNEHGSSLTYGKIRIIRQHLLTTAITPSNRYLA